METIVIIKRLLLTILCCITTAAAAWEPSRPIRVSIGFAQGSGNELSFRGVSSIIEKLNPHVTFVIESQPGADGVIAMNEFITKPNDGYHVHIPSHQGIWVTADFFHAQVKKYSLEDFEYIVSIAKSPLAVIATSTSLVNTVPELIGLLKNTNKPITFAAGSGAHKLAFDYMVSKVKVNTELVKLANYKGPSQAGLDVAGGHVEFGIIPAAIAATFVKLGKVKIIGLCSETPLAGINAPLMNKWIPGMNVYAAWGIILPKGTSAEIQKWYVDNFAKAIKSPAAKQFFDNNYMFIDEQELTQIGFKNSMMLLRTKWLPILETFKE